ncbi:hypothetical protein OIU79_028056 [Salix purpurea]|uniref:Uncharacterized protein n=1 Tax=Salix purpurea TaxID=77065 RepID=A0A9Q0VVY2_SALPP|nr:hypothetical protein OIU79_028056 [Salix purpurea]
MSNQIFPLLTFVHTTFPLTGAENINPHQLPNPFPCHNNKNSKTAFFFLSYQEIIQIFNLTLSFPYFWAAGKKIQRKKKHRVNYASTKVNSFFPSSKMQGGNRKSNQKARKKFTNTRTIMYCNEPTYYVCKRFNVIKQATIPEPTSTTK